MSQKYLGMPNAVIWCVDSYKPELVSRLYHSYCNEAIEITNEVDLLVRMEELFNELNFPFPGNNERHFINKNSQIEREEMVKVMKDEEMLSMHGDLGTFIIRVQHRQNSSWQGRITWVEQDKTLYFRSIWEMMKLIDEAMEKFRSDEDSDDTPSWEE